MFPMQNLATFGKHNRLAHILTNTVESINLISPPESVNCFVFNANCYVFFLLSSIK